MDDTTSSFQNVSKRKTFSTYETDELHKSWNLGMTNTYSPLVTEVARKLCLSVQQVQNWIGNQRAKKKRAGEAAPKKKKSIKTLSRGPSGFSLFCHGKKRGNQSASEFFKGLGTDWDTLSEDERQAFNEKACRIRADPTMGMDTANLIKSYIKNLSITWDKLEQLGVEGGGIICGEDNLPIVFGSPKAHYFFAPQTLSFLENVKGKIPTQEKDQCKSPEWIEEKTLLRSKVRQLFNTLWGRSGGKGKCVPYKSLTQGMLTVSGLPEHMSFTDPSNLGIGAMREILSVGDDITFTINSSSGVERQVIVLPEGSLDTESLITSGLTKKRSRQNVAQINSKKRKVTSTVTGAHVLPEGSLDTESLITSGLTKNRSRQNVAQINSKKRKVTSTVTGAHVPTHTSVEQSESLEELFKSLESPRDVDLEILPEGSLDTESLITSGLTKKRSRQNALVDIINSGHETDILSKKRKKYGKGKGFQTKKRKFNAAAPSRKKWLYDCILAEREVEGRKQFLVRWVGGSETWEPEENFN